MPYVITVECTACSECCIECPEGAIDEGEDIEVPLDLQPIAASLENSVKDVNKYRINYDLCNECGHCERVCPVGAIEKKPFRSVF
jgi:ferredoxin